MVTINKIYHIGYNTLIKQGLTSYNVSYMYFTRFVKKNHLNNNLLLTLFGVEDATVVRHVVTIINKSKKYDRLLHTSIIATALVVRVKLSANAKCRLISGTARPYHMCMVVVAELHCRRSQFDFS